MVAVRAITRIIFKILAPSIFQWIDLVPLFMDTMAVTNSGKEVPTEVKEDLLQDRERLKYGQFLHHIQLIN